MTNKPTNTPVLSAEEKRNEILKNNINNHWKDDKFFDSIKPTLQWAHNSMEEYAQPLQDSLDNSIKYGLEVSKKCLELESQLKAKEEECQQARKVIEEVAFYRTSKKTALEVEKMAKEFLNQKDNTNK